MNKLIVFDECVFLASEIVYIGNADPGEDNADPTWDIEIHVRGFDIEIHVWNYETKQERDTRYARLIKDWKNAIR